MAAVTTSPELRALARLRAGDAAALDTLMELLAPRVYRVAHAITRSAPDAEAVVQDVLLTVLRTPDVLGGRSAPGTRLYRAVVEAALRRSRPPRSSAPAREAALPAFLADGHRAGDREYLLADWSSAPDEALASPLAAGLEALAARDRAVLVLRDVEGLTDAEAADVLGEPAAAVKERLHGARMLLREALTRAMTARHEPAGHGRMPGIASRRR